MSADKLRELLHERVADETTVDLSARAWRAGRRVRRRRGLAVVGGVAAGAVAVSGAVAWVGSTPPPGPRGDSTSQPDVATDGVAPDPADPVPGPPDATYDGTPVWWSPDGEAERSLPLVADGPLPPVIDADTGCVSSVHYDRARVAVADGTTVRLYADSGLCNLVDISRLDQVTKPNGYRLDPTHASMLSPTGSHLMFPQDGSIAVYDVADATWSSIDVQGRATLGARWVDDSTIGIPLADPTRALVVLPNPPPTLREQRLPVLRPAFDTGSAQPYGPTVTLGASTAQAWGMGGIALPVRSPSRYYADPEHIAFETPSVSGTLAIMWSFAGADDRSKQCCPVAGWLDERTLVYESRQSERVLVAWTVGTDRFRRLSTIEGHDVGVASYASLG